MVQGEHEIAAQLHKLVFHGPYSFLDFHRKPSFREKYPVLTPWYSLFPSKLQGIFHKKEGGSSKEASSDPLSKRNP